MMKKVFLYAVALSVASFGAAVGVHAQSPNQKAADGPAPLGYNCTGGTFNSGAGANTFNTCISDTGNVVVFNNGGGEVINLGTVMEGYVVCADSGNYYDTIVAASGWGTPTISTPGVLPITITRSTTDGKFSLKQTFAKDNTEHDLTITMSLKATGGARTNVRLMRAVDADVDENLSGSFVDLFDRSVDSVWARQSHGFSLTAETFGVSHVTSIRAFSGSPTGCDIGTDATPQSYDGMAAAQYNLGGMNSNSTKTVKFVYRGY
jgi:hypothetical protein